MGASGCSESVGEANAGFSAVGSEVLCQEVRDGQSIDSAKKPRRKVYFAMVGVKQVSDIAAEIEYATQSRGEQDKVEENGVVTLAHGFRHGCVEADIIWMFMAGLNIFRGGSLSCCEGGESAPEAQTHLQRCSRDRIGAKANDEFPASGAGAEKSEKRCERPDLINTETQENGRARHGCRFDGPPRRVVCGRHRQVGVAVRFWDYILSQYEYTRIRIFFNINPPALEWSSPAG